MALDTVKLRSPPIDEGTASLLERQCLLKQGIQLSTGEVLYEITTGDLEGSYDSRIMFKVMREDWVTDRSGRISQVPCQPYVLVECSWHKFFHGQNVYGNPTGFLDLARRFVDALGVIMGNDHEMFHEADKWQVRRVDWAEVFFLPKLAIPEFFRMFRNVRFPRRAAKEARYASALHYPGKFTTFRIYHKGPEFKAHGMASLRRGLFKYQQGREGKNISLPRDATVRPDLLANHEDYKWIERKIQAVQRYAERLLRVEVQINADKLHYDFKGRYPFVSEMTDEYLQQVYEQQVFKLFKEGRSEMETVRTYDRVRARLNDVYDCRMATSLFAFWMMFSSGGEEIVKAQYKRTTFYRLRKKLVDAGVSWNQTNIQVLPDQDTALPRDFVPMLSDPRRCVGKISANSVFAFRPLEHGIFRKAA